MTCAVKCFQNTAKVLRDLQEPVKIFVTKLPVANQYFVSDVADSLCGKYFRMEYL